MTSTTLSAETPVRVAVKYHSGRGHTERFRTMGEATAWLISPAFTDLEHAVRSVTIVAPHAHYQPDPDHASPPFRRRLPGHLAEGLPHGLLA